MPITLNLHEITPLLSPPRYYGSAESSYTHYRNLQEAAKKYED